MEGYVWALARCSRLDAGYRILSFLVLGAVLLLASFIDTRFRERIGRTG